LYGPLTDYQFYKRIKLKLRVLCWVYQQFVGCAKKNPTHNIGSISFRHWKPRFLLGQKRLLSVRQIYESGDSKIGLLLFLLSLIANTLPFWFFFQDCPKKYTPLHLSISLYLMKEAFSTTDTKHGDEGDGDDWVDNAKAWVLEDWSLVTIFQRIFFS